MTDVQTAVDRLRRANPLRPDDALDPDEIHSVVVECERRVIEARRTRARRVAEPTRVATPPARMRPALVVAAAFVAALVLVGAIAIFGDASRTTPEPLPPASTVAPTTSTPFSVLGGVAYNDDLVYYADAERTLKTSVFFPAEGSGPWPVAVLYSEFTFQDRERTLARRLAERGAVVFAPVWVDEAQGMISAAEYLSGAMWDRAACAVGFAQAQAEAVGGDPARTIVVGAAGGEHPAAWIALGHADPRVCETTLRHAIAGLVAAQTQWFFQESQFDPAFTGPEAPGVDIVDRFFNPERWQVPVDLSVVLWASASYDGNSNTIEDPPTDESWIWSRDPAGTIIEDLAAVDAFEDGLITFRDNARLMHLRMEQAGIDVTYDETTDPWGQIDTAFERIWALLSQAE